MGVWQRGRGVWQRGSDRGGLAEGEGGLAEGEGGLAEGDGGLAEGEGVQQRGRGVWIGVVTFQSVDRCTHECQGFLSRQRHLDGRLRDHQKVSCDENSYE